MTGIDQNKDVYIEHLKNEFAKLKAHSDNLAQALEFAIDTLLPYSRGARDKSFDGWQLEWREVEIKSQCDYEFYPNHVQKIDVELMSKALAQYRKDFPESERIEGEK